MAARPSCLRLLVHCIRRAASRADCTAGNSKAISTAMMAMTTRSSINVKPRDRELERWEIVMVPPKQRETTIPTEIAAGESVVLLPSHDGNGGVLPSGEEK